MAELRRSNVLPFEPPGAHLGSSQSPDVAQLLGICRDRLIRGIATAFAGNLGKANDDLLGMADRATSLEHQQLYFAAMELLANRGQALLQEFRSSYLIQFEAGLEALRPGRRAQYPADLGELSLIDTEDFERDLALDKLSARAACNCANQLTALERRLAVMLHVPRIGQDDNPFYPRALFKAMLSALGTLGVGEQLSLTLLQEFERQTSVELPGIYGALNQALVDGGVLPKIPVGLARPTQRSDIEGPTTRQEHEEDLAPEPLGDWGGQAQADCLRGGPPGSVADAGTLSYISVPGAVPEAAYPGQDVFAQLLRALQATLPAGTGVPSPSPAGPFGPAPAAAPPFGYAGPITPAPGAQQLIQALSNLQRGRIEARDLPGLGPNPIDPTGGSVLRQLRSTPLVSWSHPVDAMTVDIVSLLFEAIFKDPDLSAALRAEIAKLQIPVLKVALMDKTFFSNAQDPARRLLDGIASAGIGRDVADERRLTDKVRTIVDKVIEGFDTDVDVFERQVKALEAFLQEEAVAASALSLEAVEALEAEERRALAESRVEAEIANRLSQRTVPSLVATFLDQHWRLVLAQAYRQGGEEGEGWRQAITAMDDLIWSVGPKRRAEDRERLLTVLPGLLKRLRDDLDALGLRDAWDPFFAQLIRLHVAALRAVAASTQDPDPGPEERVHEAKPAPPVYTTADFRTLAQVDAATLPLRAQQTAKHDPPPRAAAVPPDPEPDDLHLGLAQSLKVGTWVELESDRGTRKTLRLSWVSELRGVYLFNNRQGENALTLAATSLAEHLRKGTARILNQNRLTDRAVAQMLRRTDDGPPVLPP